LPRARSSSAGERLPAVPPPDGPVFRLGRVPDPFAPPPWERALPDGTFGNRFDDPSARRNVPEWDRFRVLYCGTQRAACFGETLARLRRSPGLAAGLAAIRDDEPIIPEISRPYVSVDWRVRRRIGRTDLDPALRFVDWGDPETWEQVRPLLEPIARALGLDEIDLSVVTGPHRTLTQEFSRFVYDQADEAGRPRYAGIRYISRLHPAWECWAIYDNRIVHQGAPPATIFPDDPDLLAVARLYRLGIELSEGHIIEP
jgi:hypothetical protein